LLRRSVVIGLEGLAAIIAGFAILVAFVAWRLADGHPVHLGFLVPYFERSLAAPDDAFQVKLDDLIVTWTGGPQLISLKAMRVRAVSAEGRELAVVPQIGIRLSVRGLLHGLLAPAEIEVFDPRIHIRRNPNGSFQFLATIAGPIEGQPSSVLPELLGDLLGPPDPKRATGYLRRAHLVGGTLEFEDQRTGLTWHAPKIDIDMARGRNGILGVMSAEVVELGDPAMLDINFSYNSGSKDADLHGRYRGVDVAALGLIAPDLAAIAGSHLQFDGTLDGTLNLDGRIGATRFTVSSGPGEISLPGRLDAPLSVAGLALAGQLDAGLDALTLETFTLDLGGSQLSASGRLTGLVSGHTSRNGRLRFQGRVVVDDVPVPALPHLWPTTGGSIDDARQWVVENIDEGKVDEAEANFDVSFAGGDINETTVKAFSGKLKASGLGLHYLRPLSPIRGANGTATFDATQFVADLDSGGVGSLGIQRAHLIISGLDKDEQIISIEGDVQGPLQDALQLLNQPPLGYPKKEGIDPAESAGTAQVHLTFKFPSIKDLPFSKVQLTAVGKIQNARLGRVFLDRDLTEGNFDLNLDSKTMSVIGDAKFASIPAALRWDEHFFGTDYKTRIALAANTSADELAGLGFDYRPLIAGPLGLDLVYNVLPSGPNQLALNFDLASATAAIDFAKWKKPAGVPGSASIKLDLEGQKPIAISAFNFAAGDFSGSGSARFGTDGKMSTALFDQIVLGKTRLTAVTVGFVGERVDVRIGGGEFDAEPFIGKGTAVGNTATSPPSPPPEEEKPTRPYTIAADHLDRILIGPSREIDDVRVGFDYDGLHWRSASADGRLPGGKAITVSWTAATPATHQLSIVAEDAGAALKLLGIIDNVVGGRLTITGTANDAEPKRPITGHAEISEYRLIKQSALVRLLTIATLTGLADALTGDGFQMYKFIGDFTKTGGRIDIPLARTYGPSLGLTATGYVDYDMDKIDIRGTVVPAYALNSLVGQIPLVGFLLTGGQGTGIFAVVYNATGKLSMPTIIVNPMSALAPGFLRGIFGLFPAGEGGEATALPPNFAPGKKN
jgi:hypothetical protein